MSEINQHASQLLVHIKNLKNPMKPKTQKPSGFGFLKTGFLNPVTLITECEEWRNQGGRVHDPLPRRSWKLACLRFL